MRTIVPRTRRRTALAVTAGAALFATLTSPAAAVTDVGGTPDVAYTEQAPAVAIATGFTAAGGLAYDGEYMEVSIAGQTASETLALQTVGTPDTTDGAVSVVGSSIYLGNGTIAEVIASVDGVSDGADGSPLRINFTSDFQNPGFETSGGSLDGWTAIESVVDLGVTEIAGFTTVDTATYPGDSGGNDNDYPASPGSYSVAASSTTASEGTYSLRLQSTGMTTRYGCDVVHGPAVVSGTFEASAGDSIFFDWRAFAGADAYHVFGYILDSAGNQTEVLDAYGSSSSNTDWATKETVIPVTETYRFVFVSGTYDATCGRAAGAALHIDNLKVYGNKVTDAEVQAIARLLTYENSSDAPADTRTVTIEAKAVAEGTDTTVFDIDVTQVPDEPSMGAMSAAEFDNTAADDVFADVTGTVPFTDPDLQAVTYALTDAESGDWNVGGVDYDERVVGAYATVYLDTATGVYRVVADQGADDATVSASESVEFSATDADPGTTLTADLSIDVNVATVPSEPITPTAVGGLDSADVSWSEPTWLGGSAITDYVIEWALDESGPWNVFADGTSTDTSVTVTGLTGGQQHYFRVSAVNATGTGTPFTPVLDTLVLTNQDAVVATGPTALVDGTSGELGTTGGSGEGVVTFTVLDGPCVVDGTTVTATGAGTCSIVATKAADSPYAEATSAPIEITVSAAPSATIDADDEPGAEPGDDTDDEIDPADPLPVSLCGFLPDSDVDVTLGDATEPLATLTVGDDGCLDTTIELPEDLEAATHELVFTGADLLGGEAEVTLEVVAAPAGYRPGPCLDAEWDVAASAVFADADISDYFHDAASWAQHNEIVFGRAPTELAPRAEVTRAEFITMLYRMLCEPVTDVDLPYEDIEDGAFYIPALKWAHANGIIVGTSPTAFSPDAPATRAHIATILHRLAGTPEALAQMDLDDLEIGRYFTDAVEWMASTDLTHVGDRFDPYRPALRGEAIAFLYRLNTNELYG